MRVQKGSMVIESNGRNMRIYAIHTPSHFFDVERADFDHLEDAIKEFNKLTKKSESGIH